VRFGHHWAVRNAGVGHCGNERGSRSLAMHGVVDYAATVIGAHAGPKEPPAVENRGGSAARQAGHSSRPRP
jgi:hypothetical protein